MTEDFLPINGTDYVEFYVGNAKQVAYYYQSAFGFQPLAYSGLETGDKERTSYVLVQDKIRFVFTTALTPDSVVADHVKEHGDGQWSNATRHRSDLPSDFLCLREIYIAY